MLYFSADSHLTHKNILEYCPKRKERWNTVDQMDAGLIANWNKVVRNQDEVFHLGDICFGDISILNHLNGKIHLIVGNHDRKDVLQSDRFETVSYYKELKFNKKKYVLSHYKFEVWNGSHYPNGRHLYGHSHGTRPGDNQCTDVGVDVPFTDYAPVTIDQIEEHLLTCPVRNAHV